MGAQQSKDKLRKAALQQDSAKEELTKSLSYQSNEEGSSVDNEPAHASQEVEAQVLPTLSPLPEEGTDNEPEPRVMSGLPGEMAPQKETSFYLEEAETLTAKENGLPSESFKEIESSTNPDCTKDSTVLNSSKESEQVCDRHCLHLSSQDSVSEAGNDTRVGGLCETGPSFSKEFKDIKIANENYCIPMHFDSGGLYKKKVTADNDDNRCKSPLEDSHNKPIHEQIFTNVIFLPDKSKGASPKRYGPKRLGSIYDSISEDGERIDSGILEYSDEGSFHEHIMGAILENKTDAFNEEKSDLKKDLNDIPISGNSISQAERIDVEKRTTAENSNINVQDQVTNLEELTFVEDHFGLYTGSLAEGISKEFQARTLSTSEEIGHVSNQSASLPGTMEGNNDNENKISENVKSSVSSGNSKQPMMGQKEIVHHKSDNVEISQRQIEHLANTDEKVFTAVQKTDENVCDREVIEICKKCKEPGDLCLCLFPGIKTVMSVTDSGQNKPVFSYLRYLRINEKEINWSDLKSAQAVFIKGLKSYKTEISDDNRVTFEFCLPPYKGFLKLNQRQSDPEIFEEECKNLVKTIEQKFKINLTGMQLSGSIDSSRNIMINDFDECSDDDEESDECSDDDEQSNDSDVDGVDDFSESDEIGQYVNDVENHEKCSKADCECKVKTKRVIEKVIPAQNDNSRIKPESNHLVSRLKHKNQIFHIHCSGLKNTGNQNDFFNTGNTSEINAMHCKLEDKTTFKDDKYLLHDGCTEGNQECISSDFGDSCSSRSSDSLTSNLFEKESNSCCGFDNPGIPNCDKKQSTTDHEKSDRNKGGDTQTISCSRETKYVNYKESEETSCLDIQDPSNRSDFAKETQELYENHENSVDQNNQSISESEKSVEILKDSITQERVRAQFPLKKVKTCIEDENRLKYDEDNTENFAQTDENEGHVTCKVCFHTNDKFVFQQELEEEAVDENQICQIITDKTVDNNTLSGDFSKDDDEVIQTVDFKVQRDVELEVENGYERGVGADNEFGESSESNDLRNALQEDLDREEKIDQVDEYMNNTKECSEEKLSSAFFEVSNAGSKLHDSLTLGKKLSCTDKEKVNEPGKSQDGKTQSETKCKEKDFPVENCSEEDIRNSERKKGQLSHFQEDDDAGTECNGNRMKDWNSVTAVNEQKHDAAQSGITLEHLKVECSVGDKSENQNKQFVKTVMAQGLDLELQNGNMFGEIIQGTTDKGNLKGEDENVNSYLASALKRRQTKIEVDNRLAEISSDEEDDKNTDVKEEAECVRNVREIPKSERNESKEEKHSQSMHSMGPFSFGSHGQGPMSSIRSFLTSDNGDIDFSLPPDEFMKQLQEKHAGMSGLLEKMKIDTDLDYSLPPDEFRKQLQDRNARLGGLLEKMKLDNDIDYSLPPDELAKQLQEKLSGLGGVSVQVRVGNQREHNSRPRTNRRPERPGNASSDFAASFYESSDQSVDISQLGTENPTGLGNVQKTTFRQNGNSSNPDEGENMGRNSRENLLESLTRARAEGDMNSMMSGMFSSSSSEFSLPSSRSESPVPSTDGEVEAGNVNEIWLPVIQKEKNNCMQNTKIPKNYRCTVLCVDVSASMKGSPWQQIKTFIPEFLSGLEEKKRTDKIEEYVAMVTFGGETRIVSQPTKSYGQFTDILKSFHPDGNSPLLPGLSLSLLFQTVRKELGQRHCRLHDITLGHRIILLTDGRPSPSSEVGYSDEFLDEVRQLEAVQEVETSLEEWKLPSQHVHIDCVPVGDNPNLALLESICKATNGRMVVPADLQVLVNSTHNHFITAQVAKQMFRMKTDTLDMHMFKSIIGTMHPGRTPADFAEMVALVETTHANVLAKRQGISECLSTTSDDNVHHEQADLQHKIGTRVCFGPDVTAKLLSLAPGKGTITGHSRKHRGKVFVQWDSGAHTLCNCGYEDKFEVFPDDTVVPSKVDDSIKIGYKVRRGPDWQYGNQDGGGDQLGTVYHIGTDRVVRVRWSNGNQGNYRYNQSGAFDVLISDPSDPLGTKMFVSEMNKRNEAKSKTAPQPPDSAGDANSTEQDETLTAVKSEAV